MKTKINMGIVLGLLGLAAASTVLSTWAIGEEIISTKGWLILQVIALTALAIAGAAYFSNKTDK